jgi:N-acyl-D-glucosamine 2-epimerase
MKDLNIVGDGLSTMVDLAATGWDSRATARAVWLYNLLLDLLLPSFETLPYLYQRDWSVAPDIPRAGQSLQLIATLSLAGQNHGRSNEAIAACKGIAATCQRYFSNPEGGYKFASSVYAWPLAGTDLTVPRRAWWVQTEATRGLLLLALLHPDDATYREAFARQWTFLERAMIDPQFHGFYESAEQGCEAKRWRIRGHGATLNKLNIWKDVSHEEHMLRDAVLWLRNGVRLA